MGDSILTSLSLLPSGKPPSDRPTAVDHSPSPKSTRGAGRRTGDAENKVPFIAPVIGLISNEDVPAMITAAGRKKAKDKEESVRSNGAKRKQPDDSEEEGAGKEEEEEERPARHGASKRGRRSLKKRRGRQNGHQSSRSQSLSEDSDGEPDPVKPLSPLFSACLLHQPKVLLQRLDRAEFVTTNAEGSNGDHNDENNGEQGSSGNRRAKKNVLKSSERKRKAEPHCSNDKE